MTATRARQAWRLFRRVSRWVLVAGFLGVSLVSVWNRADSIPFLRGLNLPSFAEVFGDDENGADITSSSADGQAQPDGSEPGPLDDFIASVSSTASTTATGEAQMALDGDRATGWTPCSECPSPFGQGESLTVEFSSPVVIQQILIFNGREGDAATLPVASVRIDTGERVLDVSLGPNLESYQIVPPTELTAATISISIQEVASSGETVGSTALGEIEFIGVLAPVLTEDEN